MGSKVKAPARAWGFRGGQRRGMPPGTSKGHCQPLLPLLKKLYFAFPKVRLLKF